MRAAEQQGVDARRVLHRGEQALGEDRDLVARGLAALDELDEAGARRGRELDVGTGGRDGPVVRTRADVPTVPITPTRPLRVAGTSACAPGSITPITGTGISSTRSSSAAAAAVLQATMIAFAS